MIRLDHVHRIYSGSAGREVAAVRDVSLCIDPNEFVAITGPSGCGKSTLLHLLGALDTPTQGEIFVGDLALHAASERERTLYRRRDVGIVFQFFNLMPSMTVLENVSLPLLLQGMKRRQAAERADAMLALVGMADRTGHFVHQLSGGEMQRTAIGRALVHEPKLLIADEPTGNLDTGNAERVLELFAEIHRQQLTTLMVVTHSEDVAEAASRRVRMADGEVV